MTYILTDSTTSDTPVLSARDENEKGIRPFLVEILPDFVLNFRLDRYGQLLEILFKVCAPPEGGILSGNQNDVEEYHLWSIDGFQVFRESKETGELHVIRQGNHPCGRVPLSVLYASKDEPLIGKSLLRTSAKISQLVTNWVSGLDEATENQMFAIPVLKSNQAPSEVGVGITTVLHLKPEEDEDFYYVSPDATPFEVSWGSVFRMIGFANKQMGLNPNPITDKTIEQKSGVAKAWDAQEAQNKMSELAINEQECVKYLMHFASQWKGIEKSPSVQYSTKYDMLSLATDLENLESMTKLQFPDRVLKELGKRVFQKALPSLTEEARLMCERQLAAWTPKDPEVVKAEREYERKQDITQPSKEQKQGTLK
jgi:hypothetical protein